MGVFLPFVALLGAYATVELSLDGITRQADGIEEKLTARSAEAAVKAELRHLADSHSDYAVWDDAVRALYGAIDTEFVDQNYLSSTATPTFFDTAYLIGEDGRDVFAFHDGAASGVPSGQAFGPALARLIAGLPLGGRDYATATGIVRTPWGLETVAIGPVVPNSAGFADAPKRARLLVIGKALNVAAIDRIAKDYRIDGLHLADTDADAAGGVALVDPAGAIVGRLTWTRSALGAEVTDKVDPIMHMMFLLLALCIGGLSLFTVRAVRRRDALASETVRQHQRLEGALASTPHGVCMFDREKKLVFCNARYAEMYRLPPELTAPGTALQAIYDYRKSIGNEPVDFPNYVSHDGIEGKVGGALVFNFSLADGRTIRITHLNMEGGSYVASHEDTTEVGRAQTRLIQAARRDTLTGLPNRIGFRESLGEAIHTMPAGSRVAVLCLDLDDFKGVNDVLGHDMGDALLVEVAERLRSIAGPGALVARLGGDGFGIAQIGAPQPEGARRLARAIIESLGRPYDLDSSRPTVDVSIGIALSPDHGRDAEELQKHAEMALYWMKSHGRRSFQFFDPAMNAEAQSYHQIASGLRLALERNELEVHYQPIINVATNRATGFEALLRWRHPVLGLLPPDEFIPIAEETGLIVPIGAWVLNRACADAAKWPGSLHVAVNLSTAQFKDNELATTVFKALGSAPLPAGRLELEITESILLEDSQATLAILHQLRDFGVSISMDDFGTGYSSLSYLRSFPFDKIKIDQSFVRDVATSSEAAAIVRAVIGLGAAFGLTTVAEGVETPEQLAILGAAGCTAVQGFYFSEARPVADLGEFLNPGKAANPKAA